jgi:LmbE family N-acetylglucosaminyl deacetylase
LTLAGYFKWHAFSFLIQLVLKVVCQEIFAVGVNILFIKLFVDTFTVNFSLIFHQIQRNMLIKRISILLLSFLSFSIYSQTPVKSMSSGEIEQALQKLNVVGSVLYVAAHPDDENTGFLTYLANEKLVKTSYLSMTRGDGGQNLIGKEIREQLGVIRTQELLAARRTDGADQYFTRANDFGFSKNPEETMKIWDKDKVLSDVVWVIRKTRPDIILTRFPKTGEGGHGHHTASAILAEEAFHLAGDPKKYPEQLKWVKPWQPKAIYWNAWQVENGIPTDIGLYNPLLGKSYNEIAAESRSMHKSQGFGVARSRGSKIEFASFLAGEKANQSLFDNVDFTWKRVSGSEKVSRLIEEVIKDYNSSNPSASIPALIRTYKAVQNLQDEFWKKEKSEELRKLILACAGIYFETAATAYQTTQGASLEFSASIINRSSFPIVLKSIQNQWDKKDTLLNKELVNNKPEIITIKTIVPADIDYSQPYWLKENYSQGLYNVKDQLLIGTPENKAALLSTFNIEIEGTSFSFESPLLYKWTDPTFGERYRPVVVLPAVTAALSDKVYIFSSTQTKDVVVSLTAETGPANGSLSLDVPKGWKVDPVAIAFDLKNKNEEQSYTFKVSSNEKSQSGEVKALITIGGKTVSKSKVTISYDHIPAQTLLPEASAKLVKTDLEIAGKTIGYIEGAGDEVPAILKQAGYVVTTINDQQLKDPEELSKFDAIVVGIRAYNTNNQLKAAQANLMKYVNGGGNLVVQYNVSNRLVIDQLGPYPFQISRDRVTVEQSPIKFVKEDHTLLNFPNKITQKDFEGWVQERGLYFPTKWDDKYKTIISTNDPNENPLESGILVANLGKGSYIYTSYSWFRQLPEGVPGAIRLFTNLVSYQREMKSENLKQNK